MTAAILKFEPRRKAGPPPPEVIPLADAGPFAHPVWAQTDVIARDGFEQTYRWETVMIDPDAELEDDCLVVSLFASGRPHLVRLWWDGRDEQGRFVPAGDPRECLCFHFGLRVPRQSWPLEWVRVLGRVVGEPRQFP